MKMIKYKICTKCNEKLPSTKEYFYIHHNNILRSDCKKCRDTVNKKYYNSNKKEIKQWKKKWYNNNKDSLSIKMKNYYETNKERLLKTNIVYQKTDKGKKVHRKAAKRNLAYRRRNYKWIELFENPFPDDIDVDYHHVNNLIVIPLPKKLHQSTLGNNHREDTFKLINSLYGLDLKKVLE